MSQVEERLFELPLEEFGGPEGLAHGGLPFCWMGCGQLTARLFEVGVPQPEFFGADIGVVPQ